LRLSFFNGRAEGLTPSALFWYNQPEEYGMLWLLKFVAFFVAILLLSVLFSSLALVWGRRTIQRSPTGTLKVTPDPWILTLTTLGVSLLMAVYWDHRPLTSLGVSFHSSWWQELVLGLTIGGVMLLLTALIMHMWGKAPWQLQREQIAPLLGIFRGAFGEELLFRGYPFQALVSGLGVYPATGLTSVIFGLLHYQTSGWLGVSTSAVAGLLLATAVLKTKALWMAIGIHWGWNTLEALLSLKGLHLTERYLVEFAVVVLFWAILILLPIQPHPEMEKLWREYILRP
jgi:membrane protease YdiL (CAAX protease family)